MTDALKVIRYDTAPEAAFGPLADYRMLISDDCPELPIRAGIQSARPGYEAKPHWHPYVEILHILEGVAEAWEIGREASRVTLRPGDTLVIPARTWHTFRVAGDVPMRLLGTHLSDQRIVHYDDGTIALGGRPPESIGERP